MGKRQVANVGVFFTGNARTHELNAISMISYKESAFKVLNNLYTHNVLYKRLLIISTYISADIDETLWGQIFISPTSVFYRPDIYLSTRPSDNSVEVYARKAYQRRFIQ